jgi:N-acetylmuramic acid 6-phosphate etherase
MVDLQATNQKLADRSRRIVQALTGLSREQADDCLQRAGGDVKRAAVTVLRQVAPPMAERLLQAAGGQLRTALELPLEQARPLPSATERSDAWPASSLVLAVDGGGTKTVACLALQDDDTSSHLARGLAGPSNPQAVGWDVARTNLQQAIAHAFQAANLTSGTVAAACLAIAGAGRPEDRQRLEHWAERNKLAERTAVTHDAMAVLAAGHADAIGVALVSGTGSIAFGRDRQGTTQRSGGWGHLIGDEGSGWTIARQSLRAAARAFDGRGPATQLTDALLRALDVATAQQLLQKVYQHQADRVLLARLTPIVQQVADRGDPVACEILETAAADLAVMYEALLARLPLEADDRILALAGGTLVHGHLVRKRLMSRLEQSAHPPHRMELVDDPVRGALVIARQIVRRPA